MIIFILQKRRLRQREFKYLVIVTQVISSRMEIQMLADLLLTIKLLLLDQFTSKHIFQQFTGKRLAFSANSIGTIGHSLTENRSCKT